MCAVAAQEAEEQWSEFYHVRLLFPWRCMYTPDVIDVHQDVFSYIIFAEALLTNPEDINYFTTNLAQHDQKFSSNATTPWGKQLIQLLLSLIGCFTPLSLSRLV